MKILITQDTDWLTRYPGQQHHLAEMLSLRGHEVRVIDYEIMWRTEGRRETYSRREVFENVSKAYKGARVTVLRPGIVKIPLLDYASFWFSSSREVGRQVSGFRPDIVIGFSILSAHAAASAARKSGIPFVYYWTDVQHRILPVRALQPIAKVIERRIFRQSDRILAINDRLADYMIAFGAPARQTGVVRAGIHLQHWDPRLDGSIVRKQLVSADRDVVLLFMGWLYRFSGLKEVALKLAQSQHPDLKLVIVGEGDAYEELQRIRERHGLQDRVFLTGKKPYEEIPALVAAADICLLPAYPNEKIMQDIVPIKLYEYMAMKKPVISTRLPGVIQEFGENNGIVYVDKPEDVVGKAVELTRNGKLAELGEKGRRFVERLDWENITDAFEKLLIEVIKEKKRG